MKSADYDSDADVYFDHIKGGFVTSRNDGGIALEDTVDEEWGLLPDVEHATEADEDAE